MRINEPYFHVPYRVLLENLPFISQKRINCEIYTDAPSLDNSAEKEIALINNFFAKEGLKKILHGPFFDLNSGSCDDGIRSVSQKRYMQALDFCAALDVDNAVMHTGFHPIFYAHQKSRWLERARECWQPVVKAAESRGITICIENSIDKTPDVIVELIRIVDSPNFKACFDAAHYNVFGEIPLLECLRRYPPSVIGEIHLSDNNGDADSHLALGEGKIDFAGLFREIGNLGISPIITVEPHTPEDIPKGLAYLKGLGLI